MLKNILLYLSLLLLPFLSFSQFSKTHYIPPVVASAGVPVGEQYIYISTPSLAPVNFSINEIGGATIKGTVSRDIPYIFDINAHNANQLVLEEYEVSSIKSNRGYIIEAGDVVYATVRVIDRTGNQSSEIVSKGLAALGTQFRISGLTNKLNKGYTDRHLTFASVLATENNTIVNFNDIKTGAVLINNTITGNSVSSITLNSGESYTIAVQGPTPANNDALIGALISSNKPIAVNCGSFAGSNGEVTNNIDLGFDQIVSAERTGTDYIFIKSTGSNNVEKVILIAHEDNTQIFLNGSTTQNYTINAGEYVSLLGSDYNIQGNLYVRSSKNIFAYQSVGDDVRGDEANQEMFFVPPLSCQTPKSIDNIPSIEAVGNRVFTGRVTLTTKVGSGLNFIINKIPYTLAGLPPEVKVFGPTAITGNTEYECYVLTGLKGNVSVFSTSQLYLAAYGSDGAATFGGYYSGFTFKPEINFQQLSVTQSGCIPNVRLNVSSVAGFDVFQWYFNNLEIAGANSNSYSPTQPGYYKVKATLSACGTEFFSDEIPVSDCPADMDNDKANDNIDLDNDEDGITNCTESFGNQNINLSNLSSNSISIGGSYTNSFSGMVTTSMNAGSMPFTGSADGSFVSEVPAGKTNWVKYTITFAQPVSVGLDYISAGNAADLLNSTAEYVVNSEINKTITVLNLNNQLLIDTNYDGFYESGVTEFSSFEIRFRLNGAVPLAAGTGTFQFLTNQSKMISFKHQNLSDTALNRTSLKFYLVCVPKDSDNDGIPDQLDLDSDNDGIPDSVEAQGINLKVVYNIDANDNGIDDAYGNGLIPSDFDNDTIPDYLDLDSDNDGIYDLTESGSNAPDTNLNGIIDGNNFGANGLADAVETTPESGKLNYRIADTDSDSIYNYIELDSDNDLCPDVIEAGFTDSNNDHFLGMVSPIVNKNGIVTSGTGYTTPNLNYTIAAPITIDKQPENKSVCELQNAVFTVTAISISGYQWQVSVNNGVTWTDLVNNATYSGVNTLFLTVSKTLKSLNTYQYRVFLNRTGNSCGLYSNAATLTILALPAVNSPVTLVQCDDDTDGISTFNLTQKNNDISVNSALEKFSYYTTFAGAESKDNLLSIANPLNYISSNKTIYVRIENANDCFSISQLNLVVSVTQIPNSFQIPDFKLCDDFINGVSTDTDGVSGFDFSNVTQQIKNTLPAPASNYTVSYYKNQTDFLAETDASGNSLAITNTSDYRNIGYPNNQKIWARVENSLSNDCFGFTTFNLIVNPFPNIDLNIDGLENEIVCNNLPEFMVRLEAGINDGTPINAYTYQWYLNGDAISGATAYSIEVNKEGIYSVEVKNTNNCSSTRIIKVAASDIAGVKEIKIKDLSENNSVAIDVNGPGHYVYSISDSNGPYQDSNVFQNVAVGFHTVYIKDLNGCGITEKAIAVLGAPKFFTPNGDGHNETWNVKGVNTDFYSKSIIYIFDRYGKLINQISPLGSGWDGTFQGSQMPADDYWYAAKFEDGREAKGHFSLKR